MLTILQFVDDTAIFLLKLCQYYTAFTYIHVGFYYNLVSITFFAFMETKFLNMKSLKTSLKEKTKTTKHFQGHCSVSAIF